MTEKNKEWNDKSLIAWNQWKTICSICGCPAEQKKILATEVTRAFKKKFHAVIGFQLDYLFNPNYCAKSEDKDPKEPDVFPSLSGKLPEDKSLYKSDDSDEESTLEESIPEESSDQVSDDEMNENAESDFDTTDSENQDDWQEEEQDKKKDLSDVSSDIRIHLAHEFDCGIIEKANHEKSPLNYKDDTWACISRSDDPPLKIIRGKLLGKGGIINEIAERYLRNNYPKIWEKQSSLQTPIDSDNGKPHTNNGKPRTIEDISEDSQPFDQVTSLDQSNKICIENNFKNLFSNENAAILLVKLIGHDLSYSSKKISLETPELQKCTGLSSTTIYDRWNNVIRPKLRSLSEGCLESMNARGANNFLIFLLKNQIRPEKRASSLLNMIETRMTTPTKDEEMNNE